MLALAMWALVFVGLFVLPEVVVAGIVFFWWSFLNAAKVSV